MPELNTGKKGNLSKVQTKIPPHPISIRQSKSSAYNTTNLFHSRSIFLSHSLADNPAIRSKPWRDACSWQGCDFSRSVAPFWRRRRHLPRPVLLAPWRNLQVLAHCTCPADPHQSQSNPGRSFRLHQETKSDSCVQFLVQCCQPRTDCRTSGIRTNSSANMHHALPRSSSILPSRLVFLPPLSNLQSSSPMRNSKDCLILISQRTYFSLTLFIHHLRIFHLPP